MIRTVLATIVVAGFFAELVVSAESISGEPSEFDSTGHTEATEHIVRIVGFQFVPASLSVKSGDTVTWINEDIAPHTATADNPLFDTGELKRSESKTITLPDGQTISYYCRYHPSMTAELTF